VSDEKADAIGEHPVQRRNPIFARVEIGVDERHARAGDEVVRGRDIEDRDRFARLASSMMPTLTASWSALASWTNVKTLLASKSPAKGPRSLPYASFNGDLGISS
jgi:hypothetical protein